MEYFLSLVEKRNEFCIDHKKLKECKVVNDISTSANILQCLNSNELTEDEDFNPLNVQRVRETTNGQNRRSIIVKQYKLTPYVFKLCLIRSKNSKDYANYYLLLEECFYYYKSYQTLYQEKLLSIKDDKIDKQSEEIRNQTEEIRNQLKELKNNPLISIKYNTITINENYSTNKLIDLINKCDNVHRDVNIP
jgi:hypothetical protein